MDDNLAETKANPVETENRGQSEIGLRDQEAASLLEIAGLKKPSKAIYMGLYYLMIVLCMLVIGFGTSAAMTAGFAGRLNFSLGGLYFGMAVVLLCLALYFRTKAQEPR